MSKLFIESIFSKDIALYDQENNIVTLGDKTYTYEEFENEFFIVRIYTIDEYNFEMELSDQLYVAHTYYLEVKEFYSPDPEIYF